MRIQGVVMLAVAMGVATSGGSPTVRAAQEASDA